MSESYNHIIIGAGAAGLQLMLGLLNDPDRQQESILILDPDDKKENDRTWCYWEEGSGLYDEIVHKEWHHGRFVTKKKNITLGMENYRYKMIRSIDFYRFALKQAESAKNVTWKKLKVETVGQDNVVTAGSESFKGEYVYDSRITDNYKEDSSSISIAQHFLGWVIKTDEPVFNPEEFTMMDFRENKSENCSFTYILPFDENTALVEFTFFSENILPGNEYAELLQNYIDKVLGVRYEILEEETGIIPMTNYPFDQGNKEKYMKIGTGGGWVKPSTGYSFRNSQRYIKKLLQNIKEGKPPGQNLLSSRHRFFDTIFINVLRDDNASGEILFEKLYSHLPTRLVFRFLDEQSGIFEDLRIMLLYPNLKFVKSFFSALKP